MVATCDCTAALASLKTGRSTPLPRAIQQRAEAQLVEEKRGKTRRRAKGD
jgi:Mg-chelatase subunit ChlD